jgi:acetyltransferase
VDPAIVHKTDVGGVALHLASESEVAEAARRMLGVMAEHGGSAAREARSPAGLLLQRMAPGGRETIVGLTRVPRVGPLVMFGLGGVYVEVLRDVQFRLAPLLDVDARHMIRNVRMYGLLEGVRGEPPRDRAALEETLLRVSQLAIRHPRIAEMDINPLFALGEGAIAVDARFQVEAPV